MYGVLYAYRVLIKGETAVGVVAARNRAHAEDKLTRFYGERSVVSSLEQVQLMSGRVELTRLDASGREI